MEVENRNELGEERKYLLSKKTAKNIGWILISLALFQFIYAALFINNKNKKDREQSIANLEVHDVVLELKQEKSDVPLFRAKIGNGDWITLYKPMVYSVTVGDSIIKEKGQAYFTLKKKTTQEISKWNF